jgi:SAM-dependent methyltransferase
LSLVSDFKTYAQAVGRGDYDLYIGSLLGKYDNVRVYWEDQLTRLTLRPFLTELVAARRRQGEKVRIIDLGCGTGQGYEVLTKIDRRDLDLSLYHERVLPEDEVELYLGLDLSPAMVAKGAELFKDKPNARFDQADLRDGLTKVEDEAPFDIYFSSYGSFSHLNTAELASLLQDIYEHGRDGSLVVLDLLGRHSIEWPKYWAAQTDEEKFAPYSMSYLNTEFGMEEDIEFFPMRFWSGPEVDQMVAELQSQQRAALRVLRQVDRSIMVGRHVDTREYNPNVPPLRRMVNRLHEDYMRTDLRALLLDDDAFPTHPDPEVAAFFDTMVTSWNTVIEFADERLRNKAALTELEHWETCSAPLQFAIMTVDRVVNNVSWMWNGDPRANIMEPQLGYALRRLEFDLQRGLGCGHGLLAILQVNK